jgi:hypothetical protein
MGIFNKKELARIAELENELLSANNRIFELTKYDGIADVDAAIVQKKEELALLISEKQKKLDAIIAEHDNKFQELKDKTDALKSDYLASHSIYSDLKKQIGVYTETLELSDYGIYEPHFQFDTSEKFKDEILSLRERQKHMVKIETAVKGGDTILWNNSLSQGQAMVKREKKLMLRAFNGECDSFVASVDWNNVNKMIERIDKSYDAINKVFEKQGISISGHYKKLKEDELRATHEYRLKKQEEKEEQRAIRDMMREEEKVQRDIEAAKIKADKEEAMYQKALEKVRKEMAAASPADAEKLQHQIADLEEKLRQTESGRERALSMAQQTRRGHVYVISNIGSFGENMYKIGMTRRLEPLDRITELGDASVPFAFDVHAMIFSEDAPALETALHKAFHERRVNMINLRREFFNVTLQEIEKIVHECHGVIEFTKIAEAEQYRETLAIKERKDKNSTKIQDELFPQSL